MTVLVKIITEPTLTLTWNSKPDARRVESCLYTNNPKSLSPNIWLYHYLWVGSGSQLKSHSQDNLQGNILSKWIVKGTVA
jgi:hypothetical protein